MASILVKSIPVIWVGGFIFGFSLIINGSDAWDKIEKIDRPKDVVNENPDMEAITCGKCNTKGYVKKGLGMQMYNCPNCSQTARVFT